MSKTVRVLFVCLGNICRSPTAHGVFESMLEERGFNTRVAVDSAGTAAYHVGSPPDERATDEALRRGYELSHLRARQVSERDFEQFDYILAMDHDNLAKLQAVRPVHSQNHLGLFLDFAPEKNVAEVPDPYYKGQEGFVEVLDLVEAASAGLLRRICQELGVDYDRTA